MYQTATVLPLALVNHLNPMKNLDLPVGQLGISCQQVN